MAVPVELEIFMRDLTKAGLKSAGKNIQDVEAQTKLLITALEQVRASQLHQLEVNKAAGLSYTQEAANIQALTGQIKGLKAGLNDLEKAKTAAAAAPSPKIDIDTDAVTRKTNNLKMQFSQVARELPSLAMGPQIFFLAISNNLPMLTDAIADARKQNDLLRASGLKGVPVWKQLASAMFSWQTALVAGITLLVVFGKDITNWVKNLGKAKKELDATTEAQNKWNEIHKKGGKAAQEETAKLNILYKASQDTTRSLNDRKKAVDELQKLFPNYFGKLTDEVILAGKAATAYDKLTKAIIKKGQAQAAEEVVADYTKKNFDLQRSINADTNWTNRNKKAYEAALIERDKMWENYRKVNSGSFIVDNAAKMWLSNTSEGKLIEEYEKRTANIKKNTEDIAKNNQIINDIVKQIDTSAYVEDFTPKNKDKTDYVTELANARVKAEQTVEKLRIQLMMEGREKRRAIAQQEYEETIDDIDRIEKETIKKLDKSKKKGDIVTDADYKAVRDNATTQRALQQLALNKELEAIDRDYYDKAAEAMIAYNKEYGTYQEKRAAIAAEYAKKILKAETEGERLTLQKQYKKDINALNFEEMKSGIDFAKVFGNIDIQSTESLKVLQDKLYDYINNAAKDLDPENLKELQDAFKSIDAELLERNPFDGLKQRVEAMQNAAQELEKAKDILERVQNGEQITDGYRTVTDAQGNTKIEQTYISAEKALQNYNKAKEKSEETTRNYIKAEQKAKEQVDELAAAISSIGDTVGGEAGEILNLIGGITSFVTTSIDGITQVGKTGAQALSAVEKASVILGIISAALQIMQKINELASDPAYRQYESYAAKINEINQMTDAVNDYRIAVAEARAEENSWFGESGLRDLRDFKKIQKETLDAYYNKAYESQAIYQNKQHGGWITTPFNAIMAYGSMLAPFEGWRNIWGYGGYDEGTTAAINNLRIETRKKSNGFLGTGIGGKDQKTEDLVTWARNQGLGELFDDKGLINKDLAQSIIDNYGNKLQGQTQETLEQLIELREKYDEYIEQLHEYVASMYEPLVDNFVDGIWDWFDEGKSALDSFKDYASDTFRDIVSDMLRTVVLDKVVDGLDEKIAAVYEEYSAGNISEKELMQKVAELTNQMIGNYEDNIPVLEDLINSVSDILQDAGIDLRPEDTGVNQSPQSGALTTMSQDSIATFEGIGRSVQTHLISIDKVSTEIRDQQREDSKALIKIVENTSHLLPIRELLEKIEREGLTVK